MKIGQRERDSMMITHCSCCSDSLPVSEKYKVSGQVEVNIEQSPT